MTANAHKSLQVNIFQAKTQLSQLIEKAEQGEEVIIARAGKPVVRLTALKPEKKKIRFGGLKGKVWIADDFDAPLPRDVLAEFEGGIFPLEKLEKPKKPAAVQSARKVKAR